MLSLYIVSNFYVISFADLKEFNIMALVLPSTVEELNNLHSSQQSPALHNNYMYVPESSKGNFCAKLK